ncbi:MAG TPA: RNA polymerase sigma factor [Chloroflexota bacterium]|nr:RNA polymerase sigma factor [Chloroflexota bacterium]
MVPEELDFDEPALVTRAQGGDLSAFNKLVVRFQGTVYNVCLRMLGDASAAEDACQETFFAAYRSLKSFRRGAFRGWLLRIATNQCYDNLRRVQRQPSQPLPEDLALADPAPEPADAALSAERAALLERAIRQLPDDQRLCVVLIDVQGLDYEEAAQAMNVNLGTVKSRLSRARARLRELLTPALRLEEGE